MQHVHTSIAETVHLLPHVEAALSETQYELITDVFISWASRAPQQPAICQGDQSWTYQELAESALTIAQSLLAQGHRPGNVVAIMGQRSFGLIASMMAVFLSGGILLTIDRALPAHRQAIMLQEAGAKHLLYTGNWHPGDMWLQKLPGLTTLSLRPASGQILEQQRTFERATAQLPVLHPDDAAYIFFTSGTTGIPKGVLGRHKGLSHFLTWERTTFVVGPRDRCAQLTGLSFDVVLRDIFLPLTSGATLCLPEWTDEPGLDSVLLWLEREKISLLHTVPALAQSWLLHVPPHVSLRTLRWVFFAGEPLTDMLIQRWRAVFPEAGSIANFYGPTETSLAKCFYIVEANPLSGIQPVGRPLPETQALVLTEDNRLCDTGEIGEIVLRTPFRSLGYINAPEEQQKRFIKNPFRNDDNDLLYRTGDRGRYRPDGCLEILGRLDQQVKIRGVRVEPDEVMTTLLRHPALEACVVLPLKNEQGQYTLVAYIVGRTAVTGTELRSYLSEQLPAPMIPSAFVQLEAFPLTPNGKVDRKALPAPDFSQPSQDFIAASTPLQEIIAASWSQALGIEWISVHDSFFALGGHSLLAMQVIAHLRSTLQVELSLRNFFEAPTIARQADYIARLQAAETTPGVLPPIKAVARTSYQAQSDDEVAIMPISLQQQGLWLVKQLEANDCAYNMPVLLRLHKRLDTALLHQSVLALVERHESLRTTFRLVDGQPMQVIAARLSIPLQTVDLTALSPEQQEAEIQRLLEHEMQQPFDLTHGPLLHTSVLHLASEDHLILLLMHHIISDGWSAGIISQELAELYEARLAARPEKLAPPALQYADVAHWQREELQGAWLDEHLTFWKTTLDGVSGVLSLPTDHPRPILPTHRGARHAFTFPRSLSKGLQRLSEQEGVTLYMALVAGFAALLKRYTGQDDVVIGTTAAGRNQQETRALVGYFVHTLALRIRQEGDPNVQELLRHIREVVLEAHAHQQLPFAWLTSELKLERSPNVHPLFQVLLTFDPPMPPLAAGWEYAQIQLPVQANKFDLSLAVCWQEGTLTGYMEYSTELFEKATIARMLTHWQELLASMVAAPQQSVAQLPLLTPDEQQQLLTWNETHKGFPSDNSILPQFEEQVRLHPDAVAVISEQHQLTYEQLNQRANQLAHTLRSLGVGPEVMVGLCLERSLDLIVGLLGILKAGGVYVPLAPDAPAHRLSFQVQHTSMPVLLTQASLLARLPQEGVQLLCLDRDWPQIARQSSANPSWHISSEHLAYVIYTSGSTGQPKGVLIEHQALLIHCQTMIQEYALQPEDGVLLFAAATFDASIEQSLPTLLAGARLILRQEQLWSPSQLLQRVEQHNISILSLPQAYWQQVSQAWSQLPASHATRSQLRLVVLGGEQLPPEALRLWQQTPWRAVPVLNAYGPTETTITATLYDTTPFLDDGLSSKQRRVPIGPPLPNRRAYVLDPAGQLTPIGVAGELYLGGTCLARGYLHHPVLTAQHFIPDPFSTQPGARLYKTGDLARWLPDGSLEILGRLDQQVKLRGFRIELGEIEAILTQHPAVAEVAVLLRDEPGTDKQLLAYLVARPGQSLEPEALRRYLHERLPAYMIPGSYILLDALPWLPSGKLDRKALLAPRYTQQLDEQHKEEPRTPLENVVARAWSLALNVRSVGIHDDFFALGGHSLLAMQIALQLQATTHVELPLRSFFETPTVAGIASTIEQLQQQGAAPEMPVLSAFSREAYRTVSSVSCNQKG